MYRDDVFFSSLIFLTLIAITYSQGTNSSTQYHSRQLLSEIGLTHPSSKRAARRNIIHDQEVVGEAQAALHAKKDRCANHGATLIGDSCVHKSWMDMKITPLDSGSPRKTHLRSEALRIPMLGSPVSSSPNSASLATTRKHPKQLLSDLVTCGEYSPISDLSYYCAKNGNVTSQTARNDAKAYMCGPLGSRILGYRPIDPRAARALSTVMTTTPLRQLKLDCLRNKRFFLVGDNWLRQLTLNLIDAIRPTPRIAAFFGGMSKHARGVDAKYCGFGGLGAGKDFERCGWPGNMTWTDTFAGAQATFSFAAKGYVDSDNLDLAYAAWAQRTKVDVLVLDIGRWSHRPALFKEKITYLSQKLGIEDPLDVLFYESVTRFKSLFTHGLMVHMWGGARESGHSRTIRPMSSTLRGKIIKDFDQILIVDRFKSLAGIPLSWPHGRLVGSGLAGPITDLHARLFLAIICERTPPTEAPRPPVVWEAGKERRILIKLPEQGKPTEIDRALRVSDCAAGRPAPLNLFPQWVTDYQKNPDGEMIGMN